jgi:beta-glucosidase
MVSGLEVTVNAQTLNLNIASPSLAHKFLPMLDGWITTEDGQKGWTTEFYAESPFAHEGVKPVTSYVLPSTRVRVNDQKPPGKSAHLKYP